jgi:hypothetical protein
MERRLIFRVRQLLSQTAVQISRIQIAYLIFDISLKHNFFIIIDMKFTALSH